MPFFELPNDASQGALYYEIYNPHEQSKTGLDPAKETILMLPTLLGHIGFLSQQQNDATLRARFNLVGIEPRHTGRSHARALPEYDSVTAAADLAFFLNYQGWPAVHLFSPQATSNPIALRFAYLFPECVLSMTIIGPSPVNEQERSPEKAEVYEQMLEAWGTGQDAESWAEATHELEVMVFGERPPSKDEADLFAHHLGSRVRYQPDDHFVFSVNHLGRKRIPQNALSSIQQPILVMTGTADIYIDEVEWYKEHLSGSDVSTFVVEAAPHGASNTAPGLVNRAFFKFLTNREWPKERAFSPVKSNFAAALEKVASITEDRLEALDQRSPTSPISFSVKTPAEAAKTAEQLQGVEEMIKRGDEPRIAWGFGGPIYDHSPERVTHRFSERHNSIGEIEPGTPDPGRFGLHEYQIPGERQ